MRKYVLAWFSINPKSVVIIIQWHLKDAQVIQVPVMESNIMKWADLANVFQTIWAMAFVFSQSGKHKIGAWIWVWFFLAAMAKGLVLIFLTSFSECLEHFLSLPILLSSFTGPSWPQGIDEIIVQWDSHSPALSKRGAFLLPTWCWICSCNYSFWPLLWFEYCPFKNSL